MSTAATFNIKPGSARSAAILLTSFLVKEHKFPEKRASVMAWGIAKKAKAANDQFTGEDIMTLTNEELKISVGTADKAPAKAAATRAATKELTPEQLKIATTFKIGENGQETPSKNERIEILIAQTSHYTAIANALGVGYQRVKNVKKSIVKRAATSK